MPYIIAARRPQLDPTGVVSSAANVGELNFQITCLARQYIKDNGLQYSSINDVLGALEGAKQEFYRRIAAPYEDIKIGQNGDVYSQ